MIPPPLPPAISAAPDLELEGQQLLIAVAKYAVRVGTLSQALPTRQARQAAENCAEAFGLLDHAARLVAEVHDQLDMTGGDVGR